MQGPPLTLLTLSTTGAVRQQGTPVWAPLKRRQPTNEEPMNQQKQWLAVAATKQPDGEVTRSLHTVYGSPLVIQPSVRLVEDENGVRPGLERPLDCPDVMLLVAPGIESNIVLKEVLELAARLIRHAIRAEKAGQEPAPRQLTKTSPRSAGRFAALEASLQQELIEAGATWLETGVEPEPTCEPLWIGEVAK